MKTYINKNINEWRKIYHANIDQKKVEVFISILQIGDFIAKKVIRIKKGIT